EMNSGAPGRFWLIADDYGLSPGVSRAILSLAERGRLSGTSCMTLFDDWAESARLALGMRGTLGIHLTLTDFPAASTGKRLPTLRRLVGVISEEFVFRELDAQMDRFMND